MRFPAAVHNIAQLCFEFVQGHPPSREPSAACDHENAEPMDSTESADEQEEEEDEPTEMGAGQGREGRHGEELSPGTVTILPGGKDGVLGRGIGGKLVLGVRLVEEAPIHPCADILFESALRVAESPIAVILTGMGNDGSRGARRFAARDLPVLVQEPESCVVGGMPQAAIDAGVVSHVMKIEDIGLMLKRLSVPGQV